MHKSEQHSRLKFIDFLLYWDGKIKNKQLINQFGISRQQAWQDLHEYAARHPDNIQDNKNYIASRTFKPAFITPDVDHYLNWVQLPSSFDSKDSFTGVHSATIELPARRVSAELIRILVQALRDNQRIEVDYVSLANPSREGRIIAPHTLVNTGLRWHLRAWCEKHGAYRDFVLSRFRGDAEILGKADKNGADDEAWHTLITLILEPDRRLTEAQQRVLEQDYQMQNGELHIQTRAALAQYLLQQMQVQTKNLDDIPEAQQLQLANFNEVQQWLFG
jgi:hypothetical protein